MRPDHQKLTYTLTLFLCTSSRVIFESKVNPWPSKYCSYVCRNGASVPSARMKMTAHSVLSMFFHLHYYNYFMTVSAPHCWLPCCYFFFCSFVSKSISNDMTKCRLGEISSSSSSSSSCRYFGEEGRTASWESVNFLLRARSKLLSFDVSEQDNIYSRHSQTRLFAKESDSSK